MIQNFTFHLHLRQRFDNPWKGLTLEQWLPLLNIPPSQRLAFPVRRHGKLGEHHSLVSMSRKCMCTLQLYLLWVWWTIKFLSLTYSDSPKDTYSRAQCFHDHHLYWLLHHMQQRQDGVHCLWQKVSFTSITFIGLQSSIISNKFNGKTLSFGEDRQLHTMVPYVKHQGGTHSLPWILILYVVTLNLNISLKAIHIHIAGIKIVITDVLSKGQAVSTELTLVWPSLYIKS